MSSVASAEVSIDGQQGHKRFAGGEGTEMVREREQGFSLIELLVVVLIIAILAVIAIPLFLRQQDKAYSAQARSALKNTATSIQSYATKNRGDIDPLDGADSLANNPAYQLLVEEGYRKAESVRITVDAPATGVYCITAVHADMAATDEWKTSTYNSSEGAPSPDDVDKC
jgi:prepilin-type N-terminal cleavage/methylation domain-containing protein